MAIPLNAKPNVDLTNPTEYPFGRIQDDTGSNNGTPVNTYVYGDFHQFFAALLLLGSITPNGLYESAINGYQYIQALTAYINQRIVALAASTTQIGSSRFATIAEAITGTAANIGLTPAALTGVFGVWSSDTDITKWTFNGGSTGPPVVASSSVRYKKVGKHLFVNFTVTITGTSPTAAYSALIYTNSALGAPKIRTIPQITALDTNDTYYTSAAADIPASSFAMTINPIYPGVGWAAKDYIFSGQLYIELQ